MVFENGIIFKKNISFVEENLLEGNCWALNGALFSYLTGDLHHGSAQYIIEGTRIALTKYAYKHKFKLFKDKTFAFILSKEMLYLGFMIRSGDYKKSYTGIDKELLNYLPKIKKKYIQIEQHEILGETYSIPYSFKKLANLYIVLYFITGVNDIMSRTEADPIGTFMFNCMKKFKEYIHSKFQILTPESIADYQILFHMFLNKPENKKIKRELIEYQKAKVVSVFDIEMMLQIGENESIEFKEEITQNIYKTAIAFANTYGGKIIIGISDNKKVKGLKEIPKSYERITNLILDNSNPQISPYVFPQKFRSKNIIVVEISPSGEVIMDNENNCFVRKGNINRKPSQTELKEMLRK